MLLIDAHVHIYDKFDLELFFSSAFVNFAKAAQSLEVSSYYPVIILADWSNASWYNEIKNRFTTPGTGFQEAFPFQIEKTRDETGLKVHNSELKTLFIIAGKKIITKENLEVLALCTLQDYPDHRPLRDTVRMIDESDAIPVIPWAVGKWLGKRGDVLEELLIEPQGIFFYLCDNGNRPYFWLWPRHFRLAERNGIPIISGSDPLHFASEADRIGRFGFVLSETISFETPAADINRLLREKKNSIYLYGRLESGFRFIRNQIKMQIFKKKWRKALVR